MTDILAIDPGTTKSGWVFMENGNPIDYGWFDNEKIFTLLKMYQCVVVIEQVSHYGTGMPVGKDVFQTVQYIGEFKAIAEQVCSLEVVLIKRSEVKIHLCNSARANDSTVRQALIDKWGGDQVAIGGKKCKQCKGKGWTGRSREKCSHCGDSTGIFDGTGYETPPGPLKGISGHVWAALGVGITYYDSLTNPDELPM